MKILYTNPDNQQGTLILNDSLNKYKFILLLIKHHNKAICPFYLPVAAIKYSDEAIDLSTDGRYMFALYTDSILYLRFKTSKTKLVTYNATAYLYQVIGVN